MADQIDSDPLLSHIALKTSHSYFAVESLMEHLSRNIPPIQGNRAIFVRRIVPGLYLHVIKPDYWSGDRVSRLAKEPGKKLFFSFS
jgi:hypothetical protein